MAFSLKWLQQTIGSQFKIALSILTMTGMNIHHSLHPQLHPLLFKQMQAQMDKMVRTAEKNDNDH